jgi:SAM-dependent methyltransferase
MKFNDPALRQRGRASIDFLGQLLHARRPVNDQIMRDLDTANITADTLPDDIDAGIAAYENALKDSKAFGALQLIADWHYRRYGAITTEVFDEIKEELAPDLERLMEGPARITIDPDFKAPDYWQGVDFHRTEGGWDGHPHMGYIHGELIHKKLVGGRARDNIFEQRRQAAKKAPRATYRRILDMGCSSGHYTLMLAQVYPAAQIVGAELSRRMLEHALRTANYHGLAWDLHQCAAEATPFDDASFDLVTSYILLHEMPANAIKEMFREAYRLLEPGGDLLMSDVPRYADMNKLDIVKADREAILGGEPHWRSAAQLDLVAAAKEAGFQEASTSGGYPHSLIARKTA